MRCYDCITTHYISDVTAGTCTLCNTGVNGVANCINCI